MKKLIFVLCLTGCSFAGTGTGNPKHANTDYGAITTKMTVLAAKVCEKISSCHVGADSDDCESQIASMTEYAPKLGVNDNPAPTLAQLIFEDYDGTRPADEAAIVDCQTQVEALACNDPAMQNAYDANLANPFANSAEILAPECTRVFDP